VLVTETGAYSSFGGDTQVDVLDIFRYGGTVTSWRYIGSVPYAGATVAFTDRNFDTYALGGNLLEYDNTEPWPTIDVPYAATAGVVAGVTTTIYARGTCLLVIYSAGAPFTSPAPATILRWLPGTIIQLSSQSAYTLWSRPQLVALAAPPAANYYAYLFQLTENCGPTNPASVMVLEPNVANQILPYIWGPSAQDDIFGCGDPLRPGTVSFIKEHNPDSAPAKYNLEVSNPSEPLLGGEMIGGLSLVASTKRWWALYPALNTPQRYYAVERPIGRGLVAPYARCTDGKLIYFWARDGIWATDGSTGVSLTDADLYNLFPHEGVPGADYTYNGITIFAPDYGHASHFRLGICNGFLYADYWDSKAGHRTLVYDIALKAWCVDEYAIPITVHYGTEQQSGALTIGGTAIYPMLYTGDSSGNLSRQTDLHNDDTTPISCTLITQEWDGGDLRANAQWGDLFLDCVPLSAISVTPISIGTSVALATAIPASPLRSFSPLSIGGGMLAKFLGMKLTWTDNFIVLTAPTTLFAWQPSWLSKPDTTKDRFGDWDSAGTPGAKYFRGFVLTADTFNVAKQLGFRSADDSSIRTQFVQNNGEVGKAYYFGTPFVAHLIRYEPQDLIPWRYFGIAWIKDDWPELTAMRTPWLNPDSAAKYIRGGVIPIDTGGLPVSLTIVSSDGATVVIGPFTTTANVKTPTAFAVTPFVAHARQITPSGPCRIWHEEIRWEEDPWPEIIPESTGWLNIFPGSGAAYLQGVIIPMETNGAVPVITLVSDGGATVVLTPIVTPIAITKTSVPYSLSAPIIAHQVRLIPANSCRIWEGEIQWIAEPIPELALTWKSQRTSHGLNSYHHIQRIEITYLSTADVILTIVSFDGTSPAVITLPSTAGVQKKILCILTPNKGKLYEYHAVSVSPFRLFLNDCAIYVKPWGSAEGYQVYRTLGGVIGDKARI
jgi:hypothetical protein